MKWRNIVLPFFPFKWQKMLIAKTAVQSKLEKKNPSKWTSPHLTFTHSPSGTSRVTVSERSPMRTLFTGVTGLDWVVMVTGTTHRLLSPAWYGEGHQMTAHFSISHSDPFIPLVTKGNHSLVQSVKVLQTRHTKIQVLCYKLVHINESNIKVWLWLKNFF